MARYRIEGTIVDTSNASAEWAEETDWNGNNHISRATGSQWEHETLYRSRRGRYYTVHTSQWQGSTPRAEWVSPEAATRWLLLMGHDLPEDLAALEGEVSE
ncbi:MAG: hypothetical protein NUW01_09565 [Gemmatimonadaceae bacterium]|nr:hypothetical protein [Gemmatimonadaceae bacterium]